MHKGDQDSGGERMRLVCVKVREQELELIDRVVEFLKEKGIDTNRSELIRNAVFNYIESLLPILPVELQFLYNYVRFGSYE